MHFSRGHTCCLWCPASVMKTTKYETPVSLTFSNSLCNMHFHWTHKHNMEAGGLGGVGVNDYLCMLYVHVCTGVGGA